MLFIIFAVFIRQPSRRSQGYIFLNVFVRDSLIFLYDAYDLSYLENVKQSEHEVLLVLYMQFAVVILIRQRCYVLLRSVPWTGKM